MDTTTQATPSARDGWLAAPYRLLTAWFSTSRGHADPRSGTDQTNAPLEVIQEFQELIEGNPVLHAAFHQMFEQVPTQYPYDKDPMGKPQVRDYKEMLARFEVILGQGPPFFRHELTGFPINAVLNWPMGTPAGAMLFANEQINAQFKKLLSAWCSFLSTPASCSVLHDGEDGWFGPAAQKAMPNFADTFVCDPSALYHGFASWDSFFTREFRAGMRPVASPDDASVITSACEATVYRCATKVRERDEFWLKGQPYSLAHMLAGDERAPRFVGGTVFQAFLPATAYHRWHSPVTGTVVRTAKIEGTYYAACGAVGLDAAAPNGSQAYLTAVAARALVFIEADNAAVGLMCFVAVGMGEASSCEVTVDVGMRVRKGEPLGMFHYGGSTHCLVFRPETKLRFAVEVGDAVPVNSAIATVISSVS